jgi:SAM-dependent methyltransferase
VSHENSISIEKSEVEKEYGSNYIAWKDWSEEPFGNLDKNTRRYFRAELRHAGIDSNESLKVLEIGFGNGGFLAYAREQKWCSEGTEVNTQLLDQGKSAKFSVHQGPSLDQLESGQYDLVVAFDVLEHINQHEIEEFLLAIKRVLKTSGCFLARFPNGDSPLGLIAQNGDVTHNNFIGSGKVRYYSSMVGMKILRLAGESEPIWGVDYKMFVYRLFSVPTKFLLTALFKFVFMPRRNIPICSLNLVVIFKK